MTLPSKCSEAINVAKQKFLHVNMEMATCCHIDRNRRKTIAFKH